MISAKEATDIVMSRTANWGTEKIDVTKSAGRILMEDVLADREFPPFDRVTMDGIAIRYEDFQEGIREFEIVGMQTAGEKRGVLHKKGGALEIMTGAIMAEQAEAIIRYEDIEIFDEGERKIARVNIEEVLKWKNVHKKGQDRKKGELLLAKGRTLSSSDVAILASVGKSTIEVSALPKVAIISTGDELVEIEATPDDHQIRMSNSIMIQAKLNELGVVNERFHLLDNYDDLLIKVRDILNSFDVLLISGGVSKGKADYIPNVLEELEVEKLFHKVAQRPGKPFWFGQKGKNKFVFALPGNPISTFMCFCVYFIPWLNKNLKSTSTSEYSAILDSDITFKPNLTYYAQVKCELNSEGKLMASPVLGGGSGDMSSLNEANAFMELPPDQTQFKKGDVRKLVIFRNY